MLSLVFILNLLSELEFFKDIEISVAFTFLLSFLNSPSMIFEMSPFILLLTIQLFFIKLFEYKEIDIFKYSGLKNSSILVILSIISFLVGIFSVTIFYNFSSNFKNIYLELKSNYVIDGKYLAVVTKNGLWIKDKLKNKILMINASKIENNYLIGNFITEFDDEYNVIKNIQSEKIDISQNKWIIHDAKVFKRNEYELIDKLKIETNFDLRRIKTLFSNLSSLDIFGLFELRDNYKKLNYSVTEIDLQIIKFFSYPFYLLLMTIFSSLIMLNIKNVKSTTYKISVGLFLSVIIYYLNNFSQVLGSTERIPLLISVFIPLLTLFVINSLMIFNINEK